MDAQRVINWTIVGQLSWQYVRAPTLDRCSLSQWSSSSVYSTIQSRGSISDSWYLLPARRYASAGTSYGPVCLSAGVLSQRLDESGWFWHGGFLRPILHCVITYKEIRASPKIRILPSGTFLQTLDLENFVTAYRLSKRAISLARERWMFRAW